MFVSWLTIPRCRFSWNLCLDGLQFIEYLLNCTAVQLSHNNFQILGASVHRHIICFSRGTRWHWLNRHDRSWCDPGCPALHRPGDHGAPPLPPPEGEQRLEKDIWKQHVSKLCKLEIQRSLCKIKGLKFRNYRSRLLTRFIESGLIERSFWLDVLTQFIVKLSADV